VKANTFVTETDTLYISFSAIDVLTDPERKELRKDSLYLGMVLGNNYNKVVKLNVLTSEGYRVFEGSILALTEDHVLMRGGAKVPIKAIEEVRIY
jgi:hypothetical protein